MIACWIKTCAVSLVGGGGVGRVALVGAVLVPGDMGGDGDEGAPMQITMANQTLKLQRRHQQTCRPLTAPGHMTVSRS
jgi:hypothetical protein